MEHRTFGPTPVHDAKVVICSLHGNNFRGSHRPPALTTEEHHIVPQAWQHIWRPATESDGALWYPQTVALCPTSHRNVHYWIQLLMKANTLNDVQRAFDSARAGRHGTVPPEMKIARNALEIWVGAGGDLDFLRSQQQWGQA